MKTSKPVLAILVAALILLSACSNGQSTQKALPIVFDAQNEHAAKAPQNTPTPTSTPTPTPEPMPEATQETTAFTIAWMSDTQMYTAANNDVFGRMTQWICDTQQEYNTVLTVHTGDIVYNAFREYEWQNSTAAFSKLPEGMRILTVAGNHDLLPGYNTRTPYLEHRPDTEYDPRNAFDDQGFVYYTTFRAGGVPTIVFSLSYGYEVGAADWINKICQQYADHYGILCLHNYMSLAGYSSVGKRLVEQVVKRSPNIRLVLSGHERGMAYISESLDDNADKKPDRTVHQMMMNVQDDMLNGIGYLRLLRIDPRMDTIEVVTYSPVLDRYGYKVIGGDRFGERKMLVNAGVSDFLTQDAPQTAVQYVNIDDSYTEYD